MNNSGTGVNMLSNMPINSTGVLTLDSGKIITNSFEVQLNNRNINSITTGNTNSYVQGNLRRYINGTGSYDFPVGHSLKGYQRANINFKYPASPAIADNLLVSFLTHLVLPGSLGAFDCSVTWDANALDNGFWSFTASNAPEMGNFDLTLYNRNHTNAAIGWTIMSDDGTGWALANGLCLATPAAAVQRISMNGIRKFATAQTNSIPLPVEWLYIDAKANSNSISVDWATASEEINSGFEIYRSTNQFDFNKIGWVNGHGTSNQVNKYSFEDENAKPGINYYYKLHQVDYNGIYTQSKTVTARFNNKNSISIAPNPVINQSVISFHAVSKNIKLDLIRTTGELVKSLLDGVEKEGSQSFLLDPEAIRLAPGCYIVRLIDAQSVSHVSFCYIK